MVRLLRVVSAMFTSTSHIHSLYIRPSVSCQSVVVVYLTLRRLRSSLSTRLPASLVSSLTTHKADCISRLLLPIRSPVTPADTPHSHHLHAHSPTPTIQYAVLRSLAQHLPWVLRLATSQYCPPRAIRQIIGSSLSLAGRTITARSHVR